MKSFPPSALAPTKHEREGQVKPGTPEQPRMFDFLSGKKHETNDVTDKSGKVVAQEIITHQKMDSISSEQRVQTVVDGKLVGVSRTTFETGSGKVREYRREAPNGVVLREVTVGGEGMFTDTEYQYEQVEPGQLPKATIEKKYSNGSLQETAVKEISYDEKNRPATEFTSRVAEDKFSYLGQMEGKRLETRAKYTYDPEDPDKSTVTAETTLFKGRESMKENPDREVTGIIKEDKNSEYGRPVKHDTAYVEVLQTRGPDGTLESQTKKERKRVQKQWEYDSGGRVTYKREIDTTGDHTIDDQYRYMHDAAGRVTKSERTFNGERSYRIEYEYKGDDDLDSFVTEESFRESTRKRFRRLPRGEKSDMKGWYQDYELIEEEPLGGKK
ncbi:MAG: hypothetical protein ABIG66_01225 [Candidatus Kerfeldbacteria bacterium]